MKFRDRQHAADQLLDRLQDLSGMKPIVLGIPRGAVPMARQIAFALDAELDIVLVHKFALPEHPEYAMGSVTEDGEVYLGSGAIDMKLSRAEIVDAATHEIDRLQKKRRLFTPCREHRDVRGRVVILVDDGIATGATMTAAVRSVLDAGAGRVIVAAPVISAQALILLEKEGAEVRAVLIPESFRAVSLYYENFNQVGDNEVIESLASVSNEGPLL